MGAGGSTGRQPNPMAPGHAEAEQVEEEHAEWRSPRTLEGLEEPHPGTEEDSKCFYAMLAEEEMGRVRACAPEQGSASDAAVAPAPAAHATCAAHRHTRRGP